MDALSSSSTPASRGRPFLILESGGTAVAIRSSSIHSVTLASDWTGAPPRRLLELLGFTEDAGGDGASERRERVIVLKTSLGEVPVSTRAIVEVVPLPAVMPIPDAFAWGPRARMVAGLAFKDGSVDAPIPILVLEVEVVAAAAGA